MFVTMRRRPSTVVQVFNPRLQFSGEYHLPADQRLVAVGERSLWSIDLSTSAGVEVLREFDRRVRP